MAVERSLSTGSTAPALESAFDSTVTKFFDGMLSAQQGDAKNVLLLGEGDFSFAAILAKYCRSKGFVAEVENLSSVSKPLLVATTIEKKTDVTQNYSGARDNLKYLHSSGCIQRFGVDARDLLKTVGGQLYDRIVFNFPSVSWTTRDLQ